MAYDPTPHLMKVKGGALYLQVKDRLVWLREEHPDASVEVELTHLDLEGKLAVARATVTLANGTKASEIGSETERDFPAGWIEKAATKAVGRALAALGFGTQFALELDEGEEIADSPVSTPQGARSGAERPTSAAPPSNGHAKDARTERPSEQTRRAATEGRSLVAARPEPGGNGNSNGNGTLDAAAPPASRLARGPAALPADNAGLMRKIEQASGLGIAGMRQWNDLARTYGARELGTKADLTRAWMVDLLGRINAAKARGAEQYRVRILGATTPEEVSDALAEAFKAHQRGTLSSESAEELADLADAREGELRRDLASQENESAAQQSQAHLAQAAS